VAITSVVFVIHQSEGNTMQGENQPTMPGQPPQGEQAYPGYPGYPSGPSQPLYGQPTPGQPGPYSQPMYGQPGPYSQPMGAPGGPSVAVAAPPQKKRSLKWLWITLAVVGALVIVGGGGGVFALSLYGQPAAAATQFCGDLKAQNYDSAYGMLSAKLKTQLTSDQFRLGNTQLDNAEGKVTACGAASGSGSYNYSLGSNKATVVAVVTRATQGSLQGGVHLVNESGGWKVDALDTSLLGVHLGALQALNAFCTDLASQNYTAAFALLGGSLTTGATSDAFAAVQQLHDQIDGKVTACALTGVGSGNSDTAANVTVSVTRSTLGAKTGAITLDGTGGAWKITAIADAVQGSDVGPLVTGTLFCVAMDANSPTGYATAYSLFSSELQKQVTAAKFAADFTLPTGYAWGPCAPDFKTYKVSGDQAEYSGTIAVTTPTGTSAAKIDLAFLQEAGAWKVDGVRVQ